MSSLRAAARLPHPSPPGATFAALWAKTRKSKYRAVPVTVDGIRFASKAEAKRDAELVLLERAGHIRQLERQVKFPMTVNGKHICDYIVDWTYIEGDRVIGEDKKGEQTRDFRIKFKLAHALHPHVIWRLS